MGGRTGVGKLESIANPPSDGSFLPDLCQPRPVLAVLVGAQLLALLLVLAQPLPAERFWPRLGMWSLAVQWVALLGTVGLCGARALLGSAPAAVAGALALAWLLVLTAVTTGVAVRLGMLPAGPAALGWLLARNLLLTLLVGGVALRLLYLQHVGRRREQARHRAHLELLQARMRPHFLFNSLNTIASLAASDPARAEEVTLALADLLRASLQNGERLIPLRDELALCRRYLAMEQVRLGSRLVVDWQLGPVPEAARLPPLSLQPLLENAIFHGIEPRPQGGTIAVTVCRPAAGVVEIGVANPVAVGGGNAGLHMALANLRARLHGYFGDAASLLDSTEGERHVVRLRLPCASL
jgi:two-component system sensor histidine kinase AlgZ